MSDLRAILVSVDYSDLLAVTLPWNRAHFRELMVVTASEDGAIDIAARNNCRVFVTDIFYRGGAHFNKWAALEAGLDAFGRHGWICLMDADVLWPKHVPGYTREIGKLYGPLRRMLTDDASLRAVSQGKVPAEDSWRFLPIHKNVNEWAGYSQVFHAGDPCLGKPPWHEVDYTHAGAADSWFQQKWGPNKVRCPFEVLHLGDAGQNWFGRSTPYLDGTRHPEAGERAARNLAIWSERARRRAARLDPFEPEKLPKK